MTHFRHTVNNISMIWFFTLFLLSDFFRQKRKKRHWYISSDTYFQNIVLSIN